MKLFVILALVCATTSSAPVRAAETPRLKDFVTHESKAELSALYQAFILTDLEQTSYCNEGYGDRPGSKTRMRLACELLKQHLMTELRIFPERWMKRALLEEKAEAFGMIAGRFAYSPGMWFFAPLSCTILINAGWSIKHRWLVDANFELYCDH
jgi:hypothetical protein